MGVVRNCNNPDITMWSQFTEKIRKKDRQLLARLDDFPGAVLIAGCQRSGTTMLARIITQSAGMVNYWFGSDDELDAALILSGYVAHEPNGRYCFQTTFLDDHYREYFSHKDFQLIWVLRNPFSVVYSLLYNWKSRSLDGTFSQSGADLLAGSEKLKYKILGVKSIARAKKACLLYNSKINQLLQLLEVLTSDNLKVIDYDHLVNNKKVTLPEIYQWINLGYRDEYADQIHTQSLNKKKQLLTAEAACVKGLSQPVYEYALAKTGLLQVSYNTI